MIWRLKDLLEFATSNQKLVLRSHPFAHNAWIPARPFITEFGKDRLRAGWLVLTGKADAVLWPE